MTQFQAYLSALMVIAVGVGISVFGWVCKQTEAVQLGGLFVGSGLGWIGLKRPKDE